MGESSTSVGVVASAKYYLLPGGKVVPDHIQGTTRVQPKVCDAASHLKSKMATTIGTLKVLIDCRNL